MRHKSYAILKNFMKLISYLSDYKTLTPLTYVGSKISPFFMKTKTPGVAHSSTERQYNRRIFFSFFVIQKPPWPPKPQWAYGEANAGYQSHRVQLVKLRHLEFCELFEVFCELFEGKWHRYAHDSTKNKKKWTTKLLSTLIFSTFVALWRSSVIIGTWTNHQR